MRKTMLKAMVFEVLLPAAKSKILRKLYKFSMLRKVEQLFVIVKCLVCQTFFGLVKSVLLDS